MDDAIYDSQALRQFIGVDLDTKAVPDATTLLKFRHLFERNALTKIIFTTKVQLREKTLMLN